MARGRNNALKRPIKKNEIKAVSKTAINDIVKKINTIHEQADKELSQIVEMCSREKCNE